MAGLSGDLGGEVVFAVFFSEQESACPAAFKDCQELTFDVKVVAHGLAVDSDLFVEEITGSLVKKFCFEADYFFSEIVFHFLVFTFPGGRGKIVHTEKLHGSPGSFFLIIIFIEGFQFRGSFCPPEGPGFKRDVIREEIAVNESG